MRSKKKRAYIFKTVSKGSIKQSKGRTAVEETLPSNFQQQWYKCKIYFTHSFHPFPPRAGGRRFTAGYPAVDYRLLDGQHWSIPLPGGKIKRTVFPIPLPISRCARVRLYKFSPHFRRLFCAWWSESSERNEIEQKKNKQTTSRKSIQFPIIIIGNY